jgi:hypothetical protein
MNKHEIDSQIIYVYGDKYANRTSPAYLRQVSTRPVTFQCTVCKQTVTQERFPGPTPKYCSEDCAASALQAKNEERVHKQREKRQAESARRRAERQHKQQEER